MSIVTPINKAIRTLASDLHQHTKEIFPSSVADDTASEMVATVKKVNEGNQAFARDMGLEIPDTVEPDEKQLEYITKLHQREFKPHLIDRPIPKQTDENTQLEMIKEIKDQERIQELSEERDPDGIIFTEI